jgi:hypothetical protein
MNPLEKAREAVQNRGQFILDALEKIDKKYHSYFNGIPSIYKIGAIKAMLDPKSISPRRAIRLKCCDCSGWQREEIKECTMKQCPLYGHRPFQSKETESEEVGKNNV